MSLIYQKTAKGTLEIANRALGISARLRRCLILVDGKKTTDELQAILSADALSDLLLELELAGLIGLSTPMPAATANNDDAVLKSLFASDTQINNGGGGSPESSGFIATRPATQTSPQTARRALSFAERKQRGSRLAQDLLGPMGEDIAVKIEKADSEATLNAYLERVSGYVQQLRSKAVAEKFRGDVRLPPL